MEIGSGFRTPDPSVLVELADRQHGVVSMGQLTALGYSRWAVQRRVQGATLHLVHRGVYSVGRARLTFRGHWMAAVLACGPEAVLSHFAAAALWDLQRPPSTRIDVTAPGKHTLGGVRCHVARPRPDEDRTTIDGIPVTSLNRTILDVGEGQGRQRIRSTLESVQRRDLLDRQALAALIDRSPGRKVADLTAALKELHDEAPWTQSELERRFLELIRCAGLPEPRANVIVAGELVDFHWSDSHLIVEIDGYAFHNTRRPFDNDRARDLKLLVAGERVVRLTYRQIEHGAARLIVDLRRLLGSTAA